MNTRRGTEWRMMAALVTALLLPQAALAQAQAQGQAQSRAAITQSQSQSVSQAQAQAHAQAQAEPEEDASRTLESVTRTIDITGLDVSSPAGARRLYRQIVSTAKGICWRTPRAYKGVVRARYQHEHGMRCFDDAVTNALAQVNDRVGIDVEQVAGLDRFNEAGLIAGR